MKKPLEKIEYDELLPFTQYRFNKMCLKYFDAVRESLYDCEALKKLNHRLHVKKIVLVRLDEKLQDLKEEHYKQLHKLIKDGLSPADEYVKFEMDYSNYYNVIKKRINEYPIAFKQ